MMYKAARPEAPPDGGAELNVADLLCYLSVAIEIDSFATLIRALVNAISPSSFCSGRSLYL